MTRTLGQPIVIQNVPGAGGTLGATRAMRADPDGHTILMGQPGTHATAVALYPNLPYKPDVDFEPIGMVSTFPVVIVARKDFPARDLKEFVAFVKANDTKLNVSHAGIGSVFFTTCLMLHSILKVKPTWVPFNGGAPAMQALVAGQVDYVCGDVLTSAPQLRSSARSRPTPSRRPRVVRCCRTFPRRGKPGFLNSRPRAGLVCSPRRPPRSRSSTSSPTHLIGRSTTRARAGACAKSPPRLPTSRNAANRRCAPWLRAKSRAGRRLSRQQTSGRVRPIRLPRLPAVRDGDKFGDAVFAE